MGVGDGILRVQSIQTVNTGNFQETNSEQFWAKYRTVLEN
jgi:hypothetical protein